MKQSVITICLMAASLSIQAQTAGKGDVLSLAGEWSVTLGDSKEAHRAILPGTTDTNRLGLTPSDTTETTHLTRRYAYKGAAHYRRTIDIPRQWKKLPLQLFLERTKPTWVYIDGQLVDSCNDISTPQRYALPHIKPGRHSLEIVVDNSRGVPSQIYASSHAYTEDTQTNWNGIVGDIRLEVKGERQRKDSADVLPCFRNFHIEGAHFYADGHKVFLRGKHDAAVWPLTGHADMTVEGWTRYLSVCRQYGINHVRFHSWCPPDAAFTAADRLGIYLQPELPFWGDFNDKDSTLMAFLHKEGENILREYGHHPSFRMMALGNELWGSIDKMREFVDDFRRIAPDKLYTFGSNYYLGYQGAKEGMDYFTTCRIGGEAWGSYDTHTRGSFSFADAADGGIINHFRPNTAMNFDGACDRLASPQPWQKADGKAGIPVISHETGQFQTYPDYREIEKYTGVLHPYNLETFRRRLAQAGMLAMADDFHLASGLWSVKLYKADIEADLRTRNMAGFQLLDLQDYPGQGSAFVGILDAFMESKGITTPEEWRQWCAPVVPLLVADRFCYDENETMSAKVQIANYGGHSLKGKKLKWKIDYADGEASPQTQPSPLAQGEMTVGSDDEGLIDVGVIEHKMKVIANGLYDGVHNDVRILSRKVVLSLSVDDDSDGQTRPSNTYDLWIYTTPKDIISLHKSYVRVTGDLTDDIVKELENGGKVLWLPTTSKNFVAADDSLPQTDNATPHTVGGLFQTDYWNYRMFKTICENNHKTVSPGTLGILTNPKHPMFDFFPTEMHTNWQWFPVIKNSHPLILDNFPSNCHPIVQVIDNVERNHRLGLVMEWKVGAGLLVVCMSDLEKAAETPEGRAFYESILAYMRNYDGCQPTETTAKELLGLLKEEPRKVSLQQLNNISQY